MAARPIRSGPISSPAPSSGRADTGNTVNTSFHNGDVASQQEAVRAAIAAKADGIVTTSPDPGSLVEIAKEANAANIPIINFNTPDPKASFNAYVGGDNVTFGKHWAQYLVDKGLVKKGDFVWMPVEIPGATYGVQEEEGIKSVFEPLGITYEVTEATLDQAEVDQPHGRLPHRQQGARSRRSSASAIWSPARSSASSTRSASSRAKSRSSAGAIRSTRRRKC